MHKKLFPTNSELNFFTPILFNKLNMGCTMNSLRVFDLRHIYIEYI